MATPTSIVGEVAPELRVSEWLDDNEVPRLIADIDAPIIYLYCFQSWCPGCHSHGFPTMRAVKDHYERTGQSALVEFIAIQTVFEGHDTNTADAAVESLARHGLEDIALGHDSGHPPATMADYQTGGTPWTVIIGPGRTVAFDGFGTDAEQAIALIDGLAAQATKPAPRTATGLRVASSFADRLAELGVPWQADSAPAPELVVANEGLAEQLGIDPAWLDSDEGISVLTGAAIPQGAEPLAMAYAGHQFGGYSPLLGDGRALLLGEIEDANGELHDLHLKGSGRTPFARGGDGHATLKAMLREFLMAEAMHAMDVPTTRALAVATTGAPVQRDEVEEGAILARVAQSHIRVGTFEYAARRDPALLLKLVNYTIERHYPSLADAENPALELLRAVVEAQALLVARWMLIGFVHGVMNTDNVLVSGETVDYGPCAFLDAFDPASVFSSIDHGERYAYSNQPSMTLWNLTRLAETLLPLINDDDDVAVAQATEILEFFPALYQQNWLEGMATKIGLPGQSTDQLVAELANDLLAMMERTKADHTSTFRGLADMLRSGHAGELTVTTDPDWVDWSARWLAAIGDDITTDVAAAMDAVNPLYIPRNHLVEQALDAAGAGDMEPFQQLLGAVTAPFDRNEDWHHYADPAPASFTESYKTFCGT